MGKLTQKQREVLTQTLIYHQRLDIGNCGCGWGELGKSHAEHVVSVYELALELHGA